MSTTVAFTLPWGRYHATPWDRNVNEGAVEWPPSPWRMLRALYAAWKLRRPDLSEASVVAVLGALSEPPRYYVPPFSVGHTRHYLPGIGHLEGVKGKTDTDKTFDPFVATARDGRLVVEWGADLDPDGRSTLSALLDELSYLGRAESIVDASLVDRASEVAIEHQVLDPGSGGADVLRVLAPTTPLDVDALVMTPTRVRGDRRLEPPATRWITYPRPLPMEHRAVAPPHRDGKVTAVRFAIIGNSPAARTSAVAFGDALRATCMRTFTYMFEDGSPRQLAGKDEAGAMVRGPHAHAHYLAFSAAGDPRTVDTVAIWTRAGLEEDELRAVARNHRVELPPRLPEVEDVRGKVLGLEAFGQVEDVLPELCGTSTTWRTYTPYAMTRHWKGGIDEQLASDIDRELTARELDASVVEIRLVKGNWLDYRRRRLFKNARLGEAVRAHGLEVQLSAPVDGPLALGALSHFGLGLFLPIEELSGP